MLSEFNDYTNFSNNKYKDLYIKIIKKSIKENRQCNSHYYEKHHILPKSFGGISLVYLTFREHYICHLLLTKFTTGKDKMKMSFSLLALRYFRNKHRQDSGLNSRQYEFCRSQWSDYLKTKQGQAYRSNSAKKQWTPERRAQQAEITRQQWRDGKKSYLKSAEYRQRKSEQSLKMWQDPKYRKLQTKIQTRVWADRLQIN
jgi:hypothetical protein